MSDPNKKLQRTLDLLSAETEKSLYGYYKDSRETIKKYLADLYEKYGKDGILSYSDMTKYNRLDSLNLFLSDEMKSLGKSVSSDIKSLVGDMYNKSYYGYGDIIDQQANKSLNLGIVNRDTISSLINEPSVAGLSLIETLGKAQYNNLLKMRQTLTQSMIQGESYQDAARRISDEYDKSFNDAIRIARTEGTRASGEGQTAAYDRAEELGIVLDRIWVATDDARTRESHLAMDGQVADEDGLFTIPDGYDNSGAQTDFPGGFGIAAEDINCFPGYVYAYSDKIEKCYKREYNGDLYTITVSSGEKITGTPNHPIFTDKGWVPFNRLNKGDNLARTSFNVKFTTTNPNIYNTPTMFSEIFNFLNIRFPFQRRAGLVKDFHGDGETTEVYIINIASLLRFSMNSIFEKFGIKFKFIFSLFSKRFFNSFCSFNFSRFRLFRSPNSIMSFFSKAKFFFSRSLFHPFIHCLTSIFGFISYPFKVFINTISTVSKFFRETFYGYPRVMTFDEIIDIQVNSFHGNVFNLQTNKGLYFVNNHNVCDNGNVKYFIVHNCRCRVIAEVKV
jgi:hypothetical protein